LIAAAYAIAQVVSTGVHRFVSWDEAVYLSKATPSIANARWDPSRALGLPWLLAPVAIATRGGIVAMRIWLLALTSVGLFGAFRAWRRVFGAATLVGAALFAGSWLALFFGTEAYPNLLFAFAAAAGAGWCTSTLVDDDPPRRWSGWCALCFAVAATIRPTDATLIFAGLALVALAGRRRHAIVPLLVALAGLAAGWSVWIIEAYASFGSPQRRWQDAFGHVAGQPLSKFVDTTALVPLATSFSSHRVLVVFAWWAAIVVSVAAGVVVGVRRRAGFGEIAPIGAAAPLLVAYLVFPSDGEARFLLPVYVLFALSAARALVTLFARSKTATAARLVLVPTVALLVVSAGGLFAWDVHTAALASNGQQRSGLVTVAAGREVARLAGGHPCRIGSQFNVPGVAIASGCATELVRFDQPGSLPSWWSDRNVYFVGRYDPTIGSPLRTWHAIRVRVAPGLHVTVYENAGDIPVSLLRRAGISRSSVRERSSGVSCRIRSNVDLTQRTKLPGWPGRSCATRCSASTPIASRSRRCLPANS
jgi:hypothetical protein